MAFYKSTFTNAYEQNLTTELEAAENITVDQHTVMNYKNGLTVDAGGQIYYRNGDTITFECDQKKLDYTFSTNVTGIQLGASFVNLQMNGLNVAAAATHKTEMAAIYMLMGVLFLNPSPYKFTHANAEENSHVYTPIMHVLSWEKSEKIKKINKKTVSFNGLTINGW